MNKDSLLTPFFKTIDKVFFGIEEWEESEPEAEFCDKEYEEELDLD